MALPVTNLIDHALVVVFIIAWSAGRRRRRARIAAAACVRGGTSASARGCTIAPRAAAGATAAKATAARNSAARDRIALETTRASRMMKCKQSQATKLKLAKTRTRLPSIGASVSKTRSETASRLPHATKTAPGCRTALARMRFIPPLVVAALVAAAQQPVDEAKLASARAAHADTQTLNDAIDALETRQRARPRAPAAGTT